MSKTIMRDGVIITLEIGDPDYPPDPVLPDELLDPNDNTFQDLDLWQS